MKSFSKIAVILAISICLPVVSGNAAPILTYDGSGSGISGTNYTLGWSFETNSSLYITQLGLFDAGNDGLLSDHEVGIWDISGTLLASTVVGAGSAVEDYFAYEDISPLTLAAGQSYVIGAYFGDGMDSFWVANAGGYAIDPSIALLNGHYGYLVGSFTFPSIAYTGDPYFGPSFKIDEPSNGAPVPEPSTLLLLGTGILGLAIRGRKLFKK